MGTGTFKKIEFVHPSVGLEYIYQLLMGTGTFKKIEFVHPSVGLE